MSCSLIFIAGGAAGTDETSTNKDTHQLLVVSMVTLIDIPASFFLSIFRAKIVLSECVFVHVSLHESLSAFAYVCIFHIFNNLLYSIPCRILQLKP